MRPSSNGYVMMVINEWILHFQPSIFVWDYHADWCVDPPSGEAADPELSAPHCRF